MHRRSRGRAATIALVVAVLGGAVLVAVVLRVSGQHHGDPPDRAGAVASDADPRLVAALDVLHRWDRRRAAAWTGGDVAALASLYEPGSEAGRRDVAMLRAWLRRDARPTSMRTQVLAAEVRHVGERRTRLLVTDRVEVAVGARGARSLPDDAPSTRLVVLRRTGAGDRWVVAAVYARPAATTASTSGSRNS